MVRSFLRCKVSAPPGGRRIAAIAAQAGRAPTLRAMDSRPIGVFDSGVGGLTVLHECLVTLPHEDFLYFGDSAPERFPYGTKPPAVIRRYAHEIAAHLAARDVKLLVVACNSATAAALPDLQREFDVPLIGVITPEAHAAVQATRSRRIGVMATEATVTSGRYPAAIALLDAGAVVTQVSCPDLVPLIQSGDTHGEELHAAAKRYAEPLKQAAVDTVILGCTHYPLIRPMLQRIFGRGVTLITSAEEVAHEVAATLERRGVSNAPGREGVYRFLCTGDEDSFREVAGRFLQLPLTEVERVDPRALAVAA
jgi:glutamate racemase